MTFGSSDASGRNLRQALPHALASKNSHFAPVNLELDCPTAPSLITPRRFSRACISHLHPIQPRSRLICHYRRPHVHAPSPRRPAFHPVLAARLWHRHTCARSQSARSTLSPAIVKLELIWHRHSRLGKCHPFQSLTPLPRLPSIRRPNTNRRRPFLPTILWPSQLNNWPRSSSSSTDP